MQSTYDKHNKDVALATPIPCTKDIDHLASVNDGWKELELRYDNIPLFLITWSENSESITHVRGDNEVKQIVELLG